MTYRMAAVGAALMLIAAGCTSATQEVTSSTTPSTIAATNSTAPPTTTTLPTTTTTLTATTTTLAATTTTATDPARFSYVVVAEERSKRLAVIDPAASCIGEADCSPEPVMWVELTERPHNLAAIGSVIYATHPAAGSISRVDLATGNIRTVNVGVEPHDVNVDTTSMILLVADENGGALLRLDPADLSVLDRVELPARAHDLSVNEGIVWVTLVGRGELARVEGSNLDLHPTGGSPHDVLAAPDGRIWFSNWGSPVLSVYDPSSGDTIDAPAGVAEPHHFAVGPDDSIWITDNGGSSIVGFTGDEALEVEVGPTPHHLAFTGDIVAVAVSGSGEAVLVLDGLVVARVALTTGLHGVAIVELGEPITGN